MMIYLQFLIACAVGLMAFWFGREWISYPTQAEPLSWYLELTVPVEDMPELCLRYGICQP